MNSVSQTSDPEEEADPFVQIYEVVEIRDGKARLMSGDIIEGEGWRKVRNVGLFDNLLKRKKDKN